MSSSICRSSLSAARLAVGVALVALAPTLAVAQSATQPLTLPPMPGAAPTQALGQPNAQPAVPRPVVPGFPGMTQVAPVEPAPKALPPGATIGDAGDRVKALAAEGNKSLQDLVGDSITPKEKLEVGALGASQREIMELEATLKKVKLAKQIHEELKGKDDPKDSPEYQKLEGERAALEKQLQEAASQRVPTGETDVSPVVSAITGAPGSMTATVLVPYAGVVNAQVGTFLPNGMKVVSISKAGVVVTAAGGRQVTLPLGDSVPRHRQQPGAISGSGRAAGNFR